MRLIVDHGLTGLCVAERTIGWLTFAMGLNFALPSNATTVAAQAFSVYGPGWAWGVVWFGLGLAVVVGSYVAVGWLKIFKLGSVAVLWIMLFTSSLMRGQFNAVMVMAPLVVFYSTVMVRHQLANFGRL